MNNPLLEVSWLMVKNHQNKIYCVVRQWWIIWERAGNLLEPPWTRRGGFPRFFINIIFWKKKIWQVPGSSVIDGQNCMFYVIAEPILAYFRNISLFYLGVWENIIMYGNNWHYGKIKHRLAIETEFRPIAIEAFWDNWDLLKRLQLHSNWPCMTWKLQIV